jgi:hypothetical protein
VSHTESVLRHFGRACLLVSLPYSLGLNEILQNLPLRQGLASFSIVFSPHGSVTIEPNASPNIQQYMSIVA